MVIPVQGKKGACYAIFTCTYSLSCFVFFFSLWYFANYARYILVPYLGAATLIFSESTVIWSIYVSLRGSERKGWGGKEKGRGLDIVACFRLLQENVKSRKLTRKTHGSWGERGLRTSSNAELFMTRT